MDNSKPQHKRLATKPSGLIKDWETKGISRVGLKGMSAPRDGPTRATPLVDVPGGLTDEDLESQRPPSKELKGRDATRTNEASISVILSTI